MRCGETRVPPALGLLLPPTCQGGPGGLEHPLWVPLLEQRPSAPRRPPHGRVGRDRGPSNPADKPGEGTWLPAPPPAPLCAAPAHCLHGPGARAPPRPSARLPSARLPRSGSPAGQGPVSLVPAGPLRQARPPCAGGRKAPGEQSPKALCAPGSSAPGVAGGQTPGLLLLLPVALMRTPRR